MKFQVHKGVRSRKCCGLEVVGEEEGCCNGVIYHTITHQCADPQGEKINNLFFEII